MTKQEYLVNEEEFMTKNMDFVPRIRPEEVARQGRPLSGSLCTEDFRVSYTPNTKSEYSARNSFPFTKYYTLTFFLEPLHQENSSTAGNIVPPRRVSCSPDTKSEFSTTNTSRSRDIPA